MHDLMSLIGEYQEGMAGRALSPSYIKSKAVELRVFARFWGLRDIREVNKEDLYGYLEWLKDWGTTGKPICEKTRVQYAQSAVHFGRWLYRREYLIGNPAAGTQFHLPARKPLRVIPSQEEMQRVLEVVAGPRERALFELMYSSGLRIAEALNLKMTDLRLEERTLFIRQGKGKKDRYVPFSMMAQMQLMPYLNGERMKLAKRWGDGEKSYLFLHLGGRMSWKMVYKRWNKALEAAGVARCTLHAIRHAAGTHLLENGASVRYVQELLGHECLSTTQRYTRPGSEKIKAVYRSCHPRENKYYEEVTQEYRQEVAKLKAQILKRAAAEKLWKDRGLAKPTSAA